MSATARWQDGEQTMRTGRGQRLAPEIARRRAEQERVQEALCEYAEALNKTVEARAEVMLRYPDLEMEFIALEVDNHLARIHAQRAAILDQSDQSDQSDESDSFLDAQDQITDDASANVAARREAQRRIGSGALSGSYTLETLLLARSVSLYDLAEQSGLGLDVLRALAAGEITFASAEAIPDELLIDLAVALRVDVELLLPLLGRAATAHARSFTAVVRDSQRMTRRNKAWWLAAAANAERAADDVKDVKDDQDDQDADDPNDDIGHGFGADAPDC
jgi:hypothetical protein